MDPAQLNTHAEYFLEFLAQCRLQDRPTAGAFTSGCLEDLHEFLLQVPSTLLASLTLEYSLQYPTLGILLNQLSYNPLVLMSPTRTRSLITACKAFARQESKSSAAFPSDRWFSARLLSMAHASIKEMPLQEADILDDFFQSEFGAPTSTISSYATTESRRGLFSVLERLENHIAKRKYQVETADAVANISELCAPIVTEPFGLDITKRILTLIEAILDNLSPGSPSKPGLLSTLFASQVMNAYESDISSLAAIRFPPQAMRTLWRADFASLERALLAFVENAPFLDTPCLGRSLSIVNYCNHSLFMKILLSQPLLSSSQPLLSSWSSEEDTVCQVLTLLASIMMQLPDWRMLRFIGEVIRYLVTMTQDKISIHATTLEPEGVENICEPVASFGFRLSHWIMRKRGAEAKRNSSLIATTLANLDRCFQKFILGGGGPRQLDSRAKLVEMICTVDFDWVPTLISEAMLMKRTTSIETLTEGERRFQKGNDLAAENIDDKDNDDKEYLAALLRQLAWILSGAHGAKLQSVTEQLGRLLNKLKSLAQTVNGSTEAMDVVKDDADLQLNVVSVSVQCIQEYQTLWVHHSPFIADVVFTLGFKVFELGEKDWCKLVQSVLPMTKHPVSFVERLFDLVDHWCELNHHDDGGGGDDDIDDDDDVAVEGKGSNWRHDQKKWLARLSLTL